MQAVIISPNKTPAIFGMFQLMLDPLYQY